MMAWFILYSDSNIRETNPSFRNKAQFLPYSGSMPASIIVWTGREKVKTDPFLYTE